MTHSLNLNAEQFRIAIPQLEGYHCDLGHDAIKLYESKAGDIFLWAVRDMGTNMFALKDDSGFPMFVDSEIKKHNKYITVREWYVIHVNKKSALGLAEGTIEKVTWVD